MMVQDQIVYCIKNGIPKDVVLGMGFEEFDSLHSSLKRLEAQDTVEHCWAAMIAAQGDSKMLKEWLKPFMRLIDPEQGNDLKAFMTKYGGGIK